MGHARRAKLRQAYAKFCEETSDYSGKGSVTDFAAGFAWFEGAVRQYVKFLKGIFTRRSHVPVCRDHNYRILTGALDFYRGLDSHRPLYLTATPSAAAIA
jgi:hypothetical protein